jgi:hypothetical protein
VALSPVVQDRHRRTPLPTPISRVTTLAIAAVISVVILACIEKDEEVRSAAVPAAPTEEALAGASDVEAQVKAHVIVGTELTDVHVVSSYEEASVLERDLLESNLIRATFGHGPLLHEVVVLTEPNQESTFLANLVEANNIRAASGLPAIGIIDLR